MNVADVLVWECRRCGHKTTQPASAIQAWHRCDALGHRLVALHRPGRPEAGRAST